MDTPDLDAWNSWHPTELARRLSHIDAPWSIAGGWALDLWHGVQTREHGDLEFTILRRDHGLFCKALSALEIYSAHAGTVKRLPMEQAPSIEIMQFWGYDRVAECWRVDMMIEPGTNESWVYKRDPSLKRPRREMVMCTVDGIPYLNPAAVLLFKARDRRAKDQEDFERALPKLPHSERAWLRNCLELLHPGNEWARAL